MVGTVKKSIAAIASRWSRRKASHRWAESDSLGARFIQRDGSLGNIKTQHEKFAMNARCAQVGFSATMRKMKSRISLDVCLPPTCLLVLEISLQYRRNPARCQRITVSGVTMIRD